MSARPLLNLPRAKAPLGLGRFRTESDLALKSMRETPFDGDAGQMRFLKEGALNGLVGQTPYRLVGSQGNYLGRHAPPRIS